MIEKRLGRPNLLLSKKIIHKNLRNCCRGIKSSQKILYIYNFFFLSSVIGSKDIERTKMPKLFENNHMSNSHHSHFPYHHRLKNKSKQSSNVREKTKH